jgi:hypothetical protein
LRETNQYPLGLIYNLDETSLLVKKPRVFSSVSHKKLSKPFFSKVDPVFACTAVFIVDAQGGHCQSTLILNRKAPIEFIKDFVSNEVNVVFFSIYILY